VLMVSLPSKAIFCWHMCWWSLCLQRSYFVDICVDGPFAFKEQNMNFEGRETINTYVNNILTLKAEGFIKRSLCKINY
jgi:hypothetical protein